MTKRNEQYKSRMQVKREILRNLTLEQLLGAVGGMMANDPQYGRCPLSTPPCK